MGQQGQWQVVHAFIGQRVRRVHAARGFVGVVIGVAMEPRHGEWFLLVQADDEPDATHWAAMDTFWQEYQVLDYRKRRG